MAKIDQLTDALYVGGLTATAAYLGASEVWTLAEPPSLTIAPVVSGGTSPPADLSCSTGTWTGSPTGYAYQWQEFTGGIWVALVGETASTLDDAPVGTYRCRVIATNAEGDSDPAYSNSVSVSSGAWSVRDAWTPSAYQDWTGGTVRNVIDASLLLPGGGSQARIRMSNGPYYDLAARVYIGVGAASGNEYAFDSTPLDVTVGSNTAITIVNDGTNFLFVDSDDIALVVPAGRNIVVSAYFTGPSNMRPAVLNGTRTGWRSYFRYAIDDAATVAATGYSSNVTDAAVLVSRIEQFG